MNRNDAELAKFVDISGDIGVRTFLIHGDNWREQVADLASLPSVGNTAGDIRQTADTGLLYRWDGSAWASIEIIGQNSKSANYTFVLADQGKHIYHPSADTTPRTFTIPANSSVAFPIGSAITIVNDTSAGTLTIAITTDTLVMAGSGSTGSRTLVANGVATILKVTSTRWIINGTNIS